MGAAGRASCGDSCPSWRTAPAALARLLGRIVPVPSDFLRSEYEKRRLCPPRGEVCRLGARGVRGPAAAARGRLACAGRRGVGLELLFLCFLHVHSCVRPTARNHVKADLQKGRIFPEEQ